MPVVNLKQMKLNEPTRNFDESVDANVNIPAENDQGQFGAFKFFTGVKTFFKGISALGTLASGSRLPVTDSNGNVTYTTMNDINNYVVNNALANYDKAELWTASLVNIANDTTLKAGKEIAFTVNDLTISDLPVVNRGIVITRKNSLNNRCIQEYHCNESTNNSIYYRYLEWDGTRWIVAIVWRKIATETDLNNYLYFANNNASQIGDANNLPEGIYTASGLTNGHNGWATYFTTKINNDPNYMTQIYISQLGVLRFRRKSNGTWTDWASLT